MYINTSRVSELPWESVLSKIDYVRVLPESSLLVQAQLAFETGLTLEMSPSASD